MRGAWWQLALAPVLAALTQSAPACLPCAAAGAPGLVLDREQLGDAHRLLESARGLERRGDLAGAAVDLEAAVALLPNWAPTRALLGKVCQLLGREQDARGHYQAHQFLGLLEDSAEQGNSRMLAIAEAEGLLIFRINQERISRGLHALLPDADLSLVARQHSREMRDLGYFGHTSPTPGCATMTDRFKRMFGEVPRALAENLSRRGGCVDSFTIENIEDSHRRLMMSDPHRKSILWEKVAEVGVGIAVNERGDYWITENFASDCPGES